MSTNLMKSTVVAATLCVGAMAANAQEIGEFHYVDGTGLLVMTEFGLLPADAEIVAAVQAATEVEAFAAPEVSRTETFLASLLPKLELNWLVGAYR